jgi:hypothetical protein
MSDHCREDAFNVPDGLTLDVKISVCQVKTALSGRLIIANGNIVQLMFWTIRGGQIDDLLPSTYTSTLDPTGRQQSFFYKKLGLRGQCLTLP